MSRVDDELVARAVAWCSQAGRSATADETRAALAALGWDELLAVRAVLADPPPARPLGPWALVDVARGVDPTLAAEREGHRQYPSPAAVEATRDSERPPEARADERPAGARGGAKRKRSTGPIIRRSRDRAEPRPSQPPRLPTLDDLFASEGRAVLERLVREHGARRARLVSALASGWRKADGSAPDAEDLSRLLDAHGLARGFERRERDELLHALRASAGLRPQAAASLGLTPGAFDDALDRLGATREAEVIRDARRAELRRRATLSERVRMLLGDAERLADLGILDEVEADLRARLPQHVRALRASRASPLLAALSRSLAAAPRDVAALAARLRVDVADRAPAPAQPSRGRGRPHGAERPQAARRAPPVTRSVQPAGARARPGGSRQPAARRVRQPAPKRR